MKKIIIAGTIAGVVAGLGSILLNSFGIDVDAPILAGALGGVIGVMVVRNQKKSDEEVQVPDLTLD